MRPQKYPFPWTDRQTPLPASSLDPSDLRRQTASGSDPPFFHNALDRQTDLPTDRSRESLTTIGRCAPRATRPKVQYNTIQIKAYIAHSWKRDRGLGYNLHIITLSVNPALPLTVYCKISLLKVSDAAFCMLKLYHSMHRLHSNR